MKTSILSILFLSILLFYSCSPKKTEIKLTEVSRIMNTLASDDMMGRKAGTKGAEMAADFISDEFKKIGLNYFKDLNSYKQKFEIYRVSPGKRALSINNKKEENFFAMGNEKSFLAVNKDNIEIVKIEKDDDFRSKVGEFRVLPKNYLVVVDPTHKEIFDRFKNYFGGAAMKLKLEGKTTGIWVLSEIKKVKKLNVNITNNVEKVEIENVIGIIPGKSKKDEYVLFSSHYDHLGILDAVEGDSIANGADDDASGTTAVISLAKHFKEKANNERTLVFITFTAEEVGGFGSQYFGSQLAPEKIMAGINIEMIGKPSKFGPKEAFITGFDKSDFGSILQKNTEGKPYKFHPDPYPDQQLFYRSDNATFARMGVPFHSVSSDQIDIDEYYHTVNDEIETLDMEHLTQMIEAISEGVGTIISGKDTPTRIEE